MLVQQEMTDNFIQKRLKSLGWTMKELERQSRVDYRIIWRLTNEGIYPGTSFRTLTRIADALGVTLQELTEKHPKTDE